MSQDSSSQRRGRAGRVREGLCVRAYPRRMWSLLPANTLPEILRAPLQGLCLQIKLLRLGRIDSVLAEVCCSAVSFGSFCVVVVIFPVRIQGMVLWLCSLLCTATALLQL